MWQFEYLIWPVAHSLSSMNTSNVPWSPTEGGKGVDGVDFVRIFVMSLAVCKYGCPIVILVYVHV